MISHVITLWITLLTGGLLSRGEEKITTDSTPETPRIDYIEMLPVQPHEHASTTVWYDDFSTERKYMDGTKERDSLVNYGTTGQSMVAGFDKGKVWGKGNRKVAFGDFPNHESTVFPDKQFDEIYWRVYVKHEYGWEGAPAKMSRATSIVSDSWQQAMIAHVWSGAKNSLTLDPASGVKGQTDQIVTTKYNDFDNLIWLGNKPSSHFQLTATEESGYWIMVESRAKLNTPGQADGINQLWIDGRLEAERLHLNFRGAYTTHGINAVFLESYWNKGSVKDQGRWFDNFVISTEPIGPIVCSPNPTLYKTPYRGEGKLKKWEVQLTEDSEGTSLVYTSSSIHKQEYTTVNLTNGRFTGSHAGKSKLNTGTYYCRVRQQSTNGMWSDWSRWHQVFAVE